MGRIVREKNKPRCLVRQSRLDEIYRSIRKQIGSMSFGRYFIEVPPHVIDAMAAVVVIIVHHVAQKAMKKSNPRFRG